MLQKLLIMLNIISDIIMNPQTNYLKDQYFLKGQSIIKFFFLVFQRKHSICIIIEGAPLFFEKFPSLIPASTGFSFQKPALPLQNTALQTGFNT